jgi:hypothetical protein
MNENIEMTFLKLKGMGTDIRYYIKKECWPFGNV